MAQKNINIGSADYAGDGESLRSAFAKIEDNFTENYASLTTIDGNIVTINNSISALQTTTAGHTQDITNLQTQVTALGAGPGSTLDADLTGSVFADDSTLLVDGVNGVIPKANVESSTDWDTAFSWGDHSTAGYLTSAVTSVNGDTGSVTLTADDITEGVINLYYTEARVDARITAAGSANWDTAYGWGDHSTAGYLTSETDSQTLSLVGTDLSITNGNTVDLSGFLTSVAFADLTATPTTIAGYGITDAFDGTYASLSGSPTALSDFSNDLDYADIVGSTIQANGLPTGTTFTDTLTLPILTAEPSSPVNGMVAIADGTSWDPMNNAAQTMVVYLAGAWKQIAQGGV